MKTIPFLSLLGAAVVALHGNVFAGGEGWTSDFAAAKKEAATESAGTAADKAPKAAAKPKAEKAETKPAARKAAPKKAAAKADKE